MTERNLEAQAVRAAYGARADEYSDALGAVELMAAADRLTIEEWARGIGGRVVDAGCGPGHWTAHMHGLAVDTVGVDIVPEFIATARKRFPESEFHLGELEHLPIDSGSLAGILAWYSVIHSPPERVPSILREFARCLAPGGSLLLGFFAGTRLEPFDHAVTTAYFWPMREMARRIEDAGLVVLDTQSRTDPGSRPHGAIRAVLPI